MNVEENQAAQLSVEIMDNLLPLLPCVELKSSEMEETSSCLGTSELSG